MTWIPHGFMKPIECTGCPSKIASHPTFDDKGNPFCTNFCKADYYIRIKHGLPPLKEAK